jgi:flavin reductase (DIM6/NTAB) family NADH-FMN oxidoreductase RutF
VPLIPDCLAWFECRTAQRVVAGDHVILIGHVERFAHNPAPSPLMFQAGAYRRLSEA